MKNLLITLHPHTHEEEMGMNTCPILKWPASYELCQFQYLKPRLFLHNINTTFAIEEAVLESELGVGSGNHVIQGLSNLGCKQVVREQMQGVRLLLFIPLSK